MFIANVDRSFIAYKDLVNNNILLFDCDGNSISNTNVRCSNWQILNLFEVPTKVLECITNKI